MTHQAQAELLPCPFCGSRARRSKGGAWHGTGCAGAHGCPAYLSALTYRTQEEADEAWNRRAPAPQAQRKPLSDAQIASACLSYRHDFGLLPEDERKRLMLQAREWERALGKASKAA